ncbi:MFS transporter [Enterobacter ludwigii]|uniref:MFS transporter n=1 Tax=Enterobacter ludwigii TaxID=299767 RepID=UPI00234CCA5C|nr:MFS transporter [Enterobacter ludwigii]MDC7315607.1 MFS transporter [Enterobacter ludwigii]MDI0401533.1 MFS transporter [Enterobacter ludwigii]MDI0411832.1 MFS transporter [Enterobacter ludwigii]MDI0416545.1 MFS transporter [Enterobacter ludwigii]MDI0428977.1 MFS transporter [Enterobacter ludwigii]
MSTPILPQAEPRRWAMFVILLVGAFLPPLDFFIVNVALPAIQDELSASSSAEQLVISSYAAVYAVTLITGGRLGDIYGRGKMFFIGLIGFAAASLLCGLAWSPWVLISGRVLQGATAAIMAPQALASVQAIFPEAEKPFALSIYGAVFGLASVIGQVVGGILISADLFHLGWRAIFLVNLPVALLVILFGLPLLKETRAPSAQRLDPVGMLLATATLSALIVPLIEGREAGWPWWTWLSFLAVPLLASLLWRYERRLSQNGGSPLLDPVVLRAPGLGQGLAIVLLFYSIGAFFLLFSVYLQEALQLNALTAGLLFLPFGVGFLNGPLLTPYLRRFVGNYLSAIGMGCETLGLAGLAGLIAHTMTGSAPAMLPLAVLLFITGLGQGLAMPTLVRMVTGRVAPAFSGMIVGVTSSTLQISTALSVAVIGGIFYSMLDTGRSGANITHAFIVALLAMAICLATGAALSIRLIRQASGLFSAASGASIK